MKKIFSKHQSIHVTAFMNWRTQGDTPILNMLIMADGFMQSSLILAADSARDNQFKKADIVIFPILTNVNHGIELYLKSLVWTLNEIISTDKKIEGGHNIKQLLNTAQARILELKGGAYLNEFNEKNRNLIEYIDELFSLIESAESKKDKMDFSRYPITKEYSNHFYVDVIGNVVVDLINFIERFEMIHTTLEEYTDYFYHQELMQDW